MNEPQGEYTRLIENLTDQEAVPDEMLIAEIEKFINDISFAICELGHVLESAPVLKNYSLLIPLLQESERRGWSPDQPTRCLLKLLKSALKSAEPPVWRKQYVRDPNFSHIEEALKNVKKYIYRTDNQELKTRMGTLYAQVFPTDKEEPHTKIGDLMQCWNHIYPSAPVKSHGDVLKIFKIARKHLQELGWSTKSVLIHDVRGRVEWAFRSMDKIEAILRDTPTPPTQQRGK